MLRHFSPFSAITIKHGKCPINMCIKPTMGNRRRKGGKGRVTEKQPEDEQSENEKELGESKNEDEEENIWKKKRQRRRIKGIKKKSRKTKD